MLKIFNKTTLLSSLSLLGLTLSSCGNTSRNPQAPVTTKSAQQGVQPVQPANPSLQQGDIYTCNATRCDRAEPKLNLQGSAAQNGFVGGQAEAVQWVVQVGNNLNRKFAIRLDSGNNPAGLTSAYPREANLDCGAINLNWTPTEAQEGHINFKVVDISRCMALSQITTGDIASCADIAKCSYYEEPVKIPFKILENERELAETDPWKAVGACVGAKIGTAVLGGTIGGILGGIVNGIFNGGQDTCKIDESSSGLFSDFNFSSTLGGSSSESGSSTETASGTSNKDRNFSFCVSLASKGYAYAKDNDCQCNSVIVSYDMNTGDFVNKCLGVSVTGNANDHASDANNFCNSFHAVADSDTIAEKGCFCNGSGKSKLAFGTLSTLDYITSCTLAK